MPIPPPKTYTYCRADLLAFLCTLRAAMAPTPTPFPPAVSMGVGGTVRMDRDRRYGSRIRKAPAANSVPFGPR